MGEIELDGGSVDKARAAFDASPRSIMEEKGIRAAICAYLEESGILRDLQDRAELCRTLETRAVAAEAQVKELSDRNQKLCLETLAANRAKLAAEARVKELEAQVELGLGARLPPVDPRVVRALKALFQVYSVSDEIAYNQELQNAINALTAQGA